METVRQLHKQYVGFLTSLFRGFLDDEFVRVQQVRDESIPNYMVDLFSGFFKDFEKLLNNLAPAQVVNFEQVEDLVHQHKGASSSAHRLANLCVAIRNSCKKKNLDLCLICLQQMKQEYYVLKNKMETLLRLERQILQAGGTIPFIVVNAAAIKFGMRTKDN
ncbi:hypothetical protein Pfo_006239 [Paulownia fortunei]|nr:hypothetical protein Pfo_006239 [Paulownia fortunei]